MEVRGDETSHLPPCCCWYVPQIQAPYIFHTQKEFHMLYTLFLNEVCCFPVAHFIVFHIIISVFFLSEIVRFIIVKMAHLYCSYLLYCFFLLGSEL